jgi:hypothetical protein
MVVITVDDTLSSKGRLICVERDVGELRLSTALKKLPTELLSHGVVRWAHCLIFLPMMWVKQLLMLDLQNGRLDACMACPTRRVLVDGVSAPIFKTASTNLGVRTVLPRPQS